MAGPIGAREPELTLSEVFRTEGYPINDLAAAGGWRDTPTLLASYLRTDPETIAQVVLNPTMRLAAR
jgi:hypothetical protein